MRLSAESISSNENLESMILSKLLEFINLEDQKAGTAFKNPLVEGLVWNLVNNFRSGGGLF